MILVYIYIYIYMDISISTYRNFECAAWFLELRHELYEKNNQILLQSLQKKFTG